MLARSFVPIRRISHQLRWLSTLPQLEMFAKNPRLDLALELIPRVPAHEALQVYSQLIQAHQKPTPQLYHALVTSCSESNRPEDLIPYFPDIVASGYSLGQFIKEILATKMSKRPMDGNLLKDMKLRNLSSHLTEKDYDPLIQFLIKQEKLSEAFQLLKQMEHHSEKMAPQSIYSMLFPACLQSKVISVGQQLYQHLQQYPKGSIEPPLALAIAHFFNSVHGYKQSVALWEHLETKTEIPIELYTTLLKACAKGQHQTVGKSIHRSLITNKINLNLDLYNSLIKVYKSVDNFPQVLSLYQDMIQSESQDQKPNATTVILLLEACGRMKNFSRGSEIIERLFKENFQMTVKLWNAIAEFYKVCGRPHEILSLLKKMEEKKESLESTTFVTLFNVCANFGTLRLGKEFHASLLKSEIPLDVNMYNALINMYGSCGQIDEVEKLAAQMLEKDIKADLRCTTSILYAYAAVGQGKVAIRLFEELQKSEAKLDPLLYTVALHACSRSGLVAEAKVIWDFLKSSRLKIEEKHKNTMLDVLVRNNYFKEAEEFMASTTLVPNKVACLTIMNGCRLHNNMEVAKKTLELARDRKVADLSPAFFSHMASIYAANDLWPQREQILHFMQEQGLKKSQTTASVEGYSKITTFRGFKSELKPRITRKIEEWKAAMLRSGMTPNTKSVFIPVSEEEKDLILDYHTEKRALAYALSLPGTGPIIITKNNRMCDNCHRVFCFISDYEKREIVVRENDLHRFKDGKCLSCKR